MRCPTLNELPPPPPGKTGWPWTEGSARLPETRADGSPWPKISIVTPSYNQGRFIEETLRSVLLQGYPNLEYFVIDGGSTDESVEIIRKYAPWLSGWVSEPDRGQSDAINKGLRRSSGEIFNWLNSDDYYAPGALQAVAHAFTETGAGVVGGRERRFGEGQEAFIHPGSSVERSLERTVYKGHNVQPCTFFRKAFFDEIGGVATGLHFLMDMDLYVRYGLRYGQESIVKIDPVLTNFRLHGGSKTGSQPAGFEKDRWTLRYTLAKQLGLDRDILESTRRLFPVAEHKPFRLEAAFDAELYFYLFTRSLLNLHYQKGYYSEARRCLRFLQRASPFRWDRTYASYFLWLHLPALALQYLAPEDPRSTFRL